MKKAFAAKSFKWQVLMFFICVCLPCLYTFGAPTQIKDKDALTQSLAECSWGNTTHTLEKNHIVFKQVWSVGQRYFSTVVANLDAVSELRVEGHRIIVRCDIACLDVTVKYVASTAEREPPPEDKREQLRSGVIAICNTPMQANNLYEILGNYLGMHDI